MAHVASLSEGRVITVDDPAHIIGAVVADRYAVRALIGQGSMGAVYEVEDSVTGIRAALKVLLPELGHDTEIATRLSREAKAMSLLGHRNIVELLDFGKASDGTLYVVTELVRGVSLRAVLEDGVVDLQRGLAIMRQVLEALAHAHAHGVIHRDIKPENIMLADGGAADGETDLVKVLDFGVAKLFDDTQTLLGEAKLTRTGRGVFGSPSYIAPEVVLGRSVDTRADLYSAGVVLFELLAGKPPFLDDDVVALLRMHAAAAIPTLAGSAPERAFTPQLEQLVADALAKQPELRVRSAAEMIAALDSAVHSLEPIRETQPAAAAAPAPSPPAPSSMARHRQPVTDATYASLAPPPPPRDVPTPPHPPRRLEVQVAIPAWLAGAAKQTRRRVLAAAGIVLVAITIAVPVMCRRPPATEHGTGVAATPASSLPVPGSGSDVVRRATELLAGSNHATAVELLERELARPGELDARAYLLLGHARAALGRQLDALNAYERALTRAPALADDSQLKASIVAMVESRDPVVAVIALELLADRVKPPATAAIVAQASTGKTASVRHRAFAIAERDGFNSGVDRTASWLLDLEQATTCDQRRAAIVSLSGAGDRRAAPALHRARSQFHCVEREAGDALAAVEAR